MEKEGKIEIVSPENQEVEPKEVHKIDGENKTIPNNEEKKGLVKEMSIKKSPNSKSILINVVVSILVVALGIGSGWGLSKVITVKSAISPEEQAMVEKEEIKVGDIYGKETNGFRDTAEGVLLKGGIEGEGSHRILRPGGETQTVYLTSSVIDLDPFVDHKVKVWGETFAAQKASWLMDVGRVEVIELDSEKPFEEALD